MKLIDKSAVVAEIENLLDKGSYIDGYYRAYRDGNNGALYALKNKIDTFEVKEVDLEKEYEKYYEQERYIQTFKLAKHFFELGLKAQKGK